MNTKLNGIIKAGLVGLTLAAACISAPAFARVGIDVGIGVPAYSYAPPPVYTAPPAYPYACYYGEPCYDPYYATYYGAAPFIGFGYGGWGRAGFHGGDRGHASAGHGGGHGRR
jgi:hypothetical protein